MKAGPLFAGLALGGLVVVIVAALAFGFLPASSIKLVEGYMPM